MNCSKCNEELLWGGEHDYQDYDLEGDGIVGNNSCTNEECDVEVILIHTENK